MIYHKKQNQYLHYVMCVSHGLSSNAVKCKFFGQPIKREAPWDRDIEKMSKSERKQDSWSWSTRKREMKKE